MKQTNENHSEQSSTSGGHLSAKTSHHVAGHSSTSKRRQKKRQNPTATYEDGDLRGIMAKALAGSDDLYQVLKASGVIKNAAEFFDGSDGE